MPSSHIYWLVLSNMPCLFMPPGLPKLFPSPLVWLTPLTWGPLLSSSLKKQDSICQGKQSNRVP